MSHFLDLTPDPKVLIALTHTPMLPLDALCELVDNALDSFQYARLAGQPITNPIVAITLPTRKELAQGEGRLSVRDNGLGLSPDQAEKAMRAGYSGNNAYDSLGLFGMGFNISTGKLGRTTRLITARRGDNFATEVTLDLEALRAQGNYKVPFTRVDKPTGFDQGTQIEIRSWWPEGNPNSNFVTKLVQYGRPKIQKELGRRYATILRRGNVRIAVDGENCEPFEHCHWADHRYVERRDHGRIPAVFRFNEVLNTQKRCTACNALLPPNLAICPSCGSAGLRSIEERVQGWVGIQRFDHQVDYGIDLIRNGRAIRIGEKSAFFEFEDDLKKVIKDYPTDGQYGRIIGEVHLNHVPVDFLKQDFQRQSPEWHRAIAFLRGESSLQPRQPGADKNESPIYKLYQGYRRVRNIGRGDMYPGYWDGTKPQRISREQERELYQKFEERLPGYFDDAEWWKLVEQADRRPTEELSTCPVCDAENLKSQDRCSICSHVLIGKPCLNPECGQEIAQSDTTCEHCGKSQVPEVVVPWKCGVCRAQNGPEEDRCTRCGKVRGAHNPLSREYLLAHSHRSDELSVPNCSIELADGQPSTPLTVVVYVTQEPIQAWGRPEGQPLLAIKSASQVEVFLDLKHQLFTNYRLKPETLVAAEVAQYLYDLHARLRSSPEYVELHTISNLEWALLQSCWPGQMNDGTDGIRQEAATFFTTFRERITEAANEDAAEIYQELSEEQLRQLVDRILRQSIDPTRLADMKETGEFLLYVSEETLVSVTRRRPYLCFDGQVWDEPYRHLPGVPDVLVPETRRRIAAIYLNCLETVAYFLQYSQSDPADVRRCQAALERLARKLV